MCHWREKTYASVRTVNLAGMNSLLAASSGTRCFWVGSSWSDPRSNPVFRLQLLFHREDGYQRMSTGFQAVAEFYGVSPQTYVYLIKFGT